MKDTENAQPTHSKQIDFSILKGSTNFQEITNRLTRSLQKLREQGNQHVGFVSGPVANSTDPDPSVRYQSMLDNMARMRKRVTELRKEYQFPIFASTDIFDTVWRELEEIQNLSPEEKSFKMKEFFRGILESGHITDIFMLDRWKEARGSIDEHKITEEIKIAIHYENYEKQPERSSQKQ